MFDALEFRSNNSAHRPVIDALALIARHAKSENLSYYPLGEAVPAHQGTNGDWSDLVHRVDTRGQRVARLVYEVVTFQALREQLRCKRSGSSAPNPGATPTKTSPTISSSGGPRTTASYVSPSTRACSSASSASR